MKKGTFNIFRRITMLVFILTAVLGLLFMAITYFATTHFYQASTQLLNKEVAAHIATFTSPFEGKKLNKEKADSVFYNAMVISPSIEVYFLDTTGKVIYYHAQDKEIEQWQVPLDKIKQYISSGGNAYLTSLDPKDPANPKIFSAVAVKDKKHELGYIYVILGSKEYRNVAQMLYSSHVSNLVLEAIVFVILVSAIISFFYVRMIRKRFNGITETLYAFQQGNLDARFPVNGNDDMAGIANAFNKMADQLVYHVNRLSKSESERKDFIVNISHDLRTPLSVARGYTETMLIKKDQRELLEEYAPLVLQKILQVERMVNQLFELSKMESVHFIPAKEPFIFAEIVQEVLSAVKLQASQKKLRIDCENCSDNTWIRGDIRMMESVIQNLVVNALNYTKPNGTIHVLLKSKEEVLQFQITNEAALLPAPLLQWLNHSDNENPVQKPAQSVIGLTIVKKILHLHDFKFSAKHLADHGNVFIIRMPVYKV